MAFSLVLFLSKIPFVLAYNGPPKKLAFSDYRYYDIIPSFINKT
jgi:hypothetical protein